MYSIYKITNIQNNKIYVGQTIKSLKSRLTQHIYCAEHGLNTKFSNAIRKYGKDNFIIEKIDCANNKEEADVKEIYWIKKLKSRNRNIGYNSTNGGDGGNTYVDKTESEMKEISKKISIKLSGENNGKHRTIYVKNVLTNEVQRYGSIADFCKMFTPRIEKEEVIKRLNFAESYNIQSLFENIYIFSNTTEFSPYTNFQTKKGETPRKVTNLSTGEVFYCICLRESVKHFNLKNKRSLKSKNFKIEKYWEIS